MKKESKFKKGDRVITKTDSVYQNTQESLNALRGNVVNVDTYSPYICVKMDGKQLGVLYFSEEELEHLKD